MSQPIDVIIPVYNAYEDICLCLDSVLRTTSGPDRVILIDDCSPDPRIKHYFDALEKNGDTRLMLLRNTSNLGFVGTVNRGMDLGRNDVILLNSDTVVTPGWIDKIRRCAESDMKIGTITPFSNNAEICSFPNFCEENSLPPGMSAEDVNRAIESAAFPLYPDIPTAVGFCMYIRRALLDKIGLFDAETFRLGYGEENDFCMRAVAAGWRNVLCDDTYILHTGSRSFDSKKQALTEQNMQRLLAKHPDYMKRVMDFIARDPIKPIRQLALSFLPLANNGNERPGVLHITHARGGGTEQHILGLMREQGSCRHYMLITDGDVWLLKDENSGTPVTFKFTRGQDQLWADFLGQICGQFKIRLCHVHHLSGCRLGLLEALSTLEIPYGFSVHDYYLACPTINLLDDSGIYCGGVTDAGQCALCLGKQADFHGYSIVEWREAHRKFLQRSAFVLAPSNAAASLFGKYFDLPSIRVIPHGMAVEPETPSALPSVMLLPKDELHTIGVLGAIGPVKGARLLELLVKRTKERGLPIRWVVVGYLDRQFQPYQNNDASLTVHGHYAPRHIKNLFDHYRIELVVFPSAGPETYCYTLSEVWASGRPVLVPPMGALQERVEESEAGWVMHDWRSADAILDDIVSILSPDNGMELELKTAVAQAIRLFSMQEMLAATESAYEESLARPVSIHAKPMTKDALYAALLAELDTGSRPPPTLARRWLLRLAHAGLRVRYTAFGRWLYRAVPVRWQRGLKRALLSGGTDDRHPA